MFICKSAPRQCREIRLKISLFIAFAPAAGNIPGAVPPAKFRHAVICFIPQGVGKQPAVILFVPACALPGKTAAPFPDILPCASSFFVSLCKTDKLLNIKTAQSKAVFPPFHSPPLSARQNSRRPHCHFSFLCARCPCIFSKAFICRFYRQKISRQRPSVTVCRRSDSFYFLFLAGGHRAEKQVFLSHFLPENFCLFCLRSLPLPASILPRFHI